MKVVEKDRKVEVVAETIMRYAGDAFSDADMRAFGASDAACYKYPGADQAALRQAYCEGAADTVPQARAAMPDDALTMARDTLLFRHEMCGWTSESIRTVIHKIDHALGQPETPLRCLSDYGPTMENNDESA